MESREEGDEVVTQQSPFEEVRVGFWLACISLALATTCLWSSPNWHFSFAQIAPWLIAGAVISIAALVLCIAGRGRIGLRVAGLLLGIASLAIWVFTIALGLAAAAGSSR